MNRIGGIAAIAIFAAIVPCAALARAKAPPSPPLLPRPRVSITSALKIAARDVSLHGPLAGHGGYISGVEYGRFLKLSSGARTQGVAPQSLVWAITYTDPTTRSKARQIISAATGKVLTRVYYAPGLP